MATRTKPTPRMRRTLAATLLAVVVALTPALTPLLAPAWAGGGEGGTGSTDTGGTSGTTTVFTGGCTGSSSCMPDLVCDFATGALVHVVGNVATPYRENYPRCQDSVTSSSYNLHQYKIELCPVGMQVFRFYGTEKNPAQAWTTAYANTDADCSKATFAFHTGNGYDAHLPTKKANYTRDRGYDTGVLFDHTNDHTVVPSMQGIWESVTRNGYMAGPAFDHKGSCRTVMNRINPYEALIDNPKLSPEQRQEAAEAVWDKVYMPNLRATQNRVLALREAGLKSASKHGNRYHLVFDHDHPCGSAMDFISTSDPNKPDTPEQQAQTRFTGYCYIPLDKVAHMYWQKGQGFKPSYDTLYNGLGLRYSRVYHGDARTAEHNQYTQDASPRLRSAEHRVQRAWRDTMYNWYKQQTRKGDQALWLKVWGGPAFQYWIRDQRLPADPYQLVPGTSKPRHGTDGQPFNREAAARALRNSSKCVFNTRYDMTLNPAPSTSTSSTQSNKVNTSFSLRMDNQRVMQAGGYGRVQQVTLTPEDLLCRGDVKTCAATAPRLARLSYKVKVAMPARYKMCGTNDTDTTGCDFKVVSVSKGTAPVACVAHGSTCTFNYDERTSYPPATTIKLVFFNPTVDADKFSVTVSNLAATYRWVKTVWLTQRDYVCNANHTSCQWETSSIPKQVVKHAVDSVRVTGTPVPVHGGRYEAPVIGAIASGSD